MRDPAPFGAFEFLVARRYLRARRQEGFISVIASFSLIGIALGVAALIVVMSVMNGLRQDLVARVIGLHGHITVHGPAGRLSGYEDLAERVRGVAGVVRVAPVVEGQAMATSPQGGAAGAVVRGMPAGDLAAKRVLAVAASLNEDEEGVILGDRLAGRLGVGVGDRVTLLAPARGDPRRNLAPRARGFRVAGTFHVGMYEYDAGYIFMPLGAAQTYFEQPETVSFLEVMVADPQRLDAAKQAVAGIAGPAKIHDWQQSNASFFNALQVERTVTFLLLTLVILVAAFNIVSSLVMLVKDKGQGIAIMRTMGATRGMIMRIFFISGASVGLVGTLVGLVLGLTLATNVETIRELLQAIGGGAMFAAEVDFLARLPSRVEAGEVLAVAVLALGLSFAATLFPSWRAARLDPVEALRYE